MPRIRSIKPEFWTDSKIVGLSPHARLLFVGAWNFADDFGCVPADPLQLKLRVLPADPVDAEALVDELIKQGLLVEMETADGVVFWHVTHWDRHQRVSKPSPSEYGPPDSWGFHESSPNIPEDSADLSESESANPSTRLFTESSGGLPESSAIPRSLRKGVEGSGRERKGVLAAKAPPAEDELWDALVEVFEIPTNDNTVGKRRKAHKLLRQSDATPDQVRIRYRAWPMHFPDTTITDIALANHWDELGRPPARASKADAEKYQNEVRRLQDRRRAEEMTAELEG